MPQMGTERSNNDLMTRVVDQGKKQYFSLSNKKTLFPLLRMEYHICIGYQGIVLYGTDK